MPAQPVGQQRVDRRLVRPVQAVGQEQECEGKAHRDRPLPRPAGDKGARVRISGACRVGRRRRVPHGAQGLREVLRRCPGRGAAGQDARLPGPQGHARGDDGAARPRRPQPARDARASRGGTAHQPPRRRRREGVHRLRPLRKRDPRLRHVAEADPAGLQGRVGEQRGVARGQGRAGGGRVQRRRRRERGHGLRARRQGRRADRRHRDARP
mmetsp:Transcript_15534/g.53064  ORF Transcript_15534/g.53064 Transcript_15534/m.53064 type:complete len:211 (-) Transcript_15534:260-892(-)